MNGSASSNGTMHRSPMNSGLYVGSIRHRRFGTVANEFRYPVFMLYLDLGELDRVFSGRWLWSVRRPALAWFRRADHWGDPAIPLDAAIRDLVLERTGRRPSGPIRLLTHLRYFGYVQNPVSFYYCLDPAGEEIEYVVAEVTNTPWGERHMYVVPGPARRTVNFAKAFHVSPFQPMEQLLGWRFTTPSDRLAAHMVNTERGATLFDATLLLRRRPISGATLAGALARFPVMTLSVVARIYWQALRLWLAGAPFHPHPRTRTTDARPAVTR
jgi:uncharacterized protein